MVYGLYFNLRQKLIFQTFNGNQKIYQGYLHTHFGQIMWIRQLSGDIQSKVIVIVDFCVTQLNGRATSQYCDTSTENRTEGRIDGLFDIFDKQRQTLANTGNIK